jgi:hypothetical protein
LAPANPRQVYIEVWYRVIRHSWRPWHFILFCFFFCFFFALRFYTKSNPLPVPVPVKAMSASIEIIDDALNLYFWTFYIVRRRQVAKSLICGPVWEVSSSILGPETGSDHRSFVANFCAGILPQSFQSLNAKSRSRKPKLTAVGDPLRWPRDTPLSAKSWH